VSPALGQPALWTFTGPATAEGLTDPSGLDLFCCGTQGFVSSYAVTPAGAAVYTVGHLSGTDTMKIKVTPLASPMTGGVTTAFTVTFGSATAPAGYVFDVQIKRHGSAFEPWTTGVTAASETFVPDAGTGSYSFRALIRRLSNGATASYSPAVKITVA
jgi:hypothetical protein